MGDNNTKPDFLWKGLLITVGLEIISLLRGRTRNHRAKPLVYACTKLYKNYSVKQPQNMEERASVMSWIKQNKQNKHKQY